MLEKKHVFISTPNIGQGNPASAHACEGILSEQEGVQPTLHVIDELSIAIKRFIQTAITQSELLSSVYTGHSRSLRQNSIAGTLARIYSGKLRKMLESQEKNYDYGVFVQEHQLIAFTREKLAEIFPEGTFLLIPDVYAKESAIPIIQRTGVMPLVWNTDAAQDLKDEGIDSLLVSPFLPYPSHSYGSAIQKNPGKDKVYIKTAGSGIARNSLQKLRRLLEQKNVKYRIYFPNAVESAEGRKVSFKHRYTEKPSDFYRDIAIHPPGVLISYASEVVQMVAWLKAKSWSGKFWALPPRGDHERRNVEWAISHGICSGTLEMEASELDDTSLADSIVSTQALNTLGEKLGSENIGQVILNI